MPSRKAKVGAALAGVVGVAVVGNYDPVEVQKYLGHVWFCMEKEAVRDDYRPPNQC